MTEFHQCFANFALVLQFSWARQKVHGRAKISWARQNFAGAPKISWARQKFHGRTKNFMGEPKNSRAHQKFHGRVKNFMGAPKIVGAQGARALQFRRAKLIGRAGAWAR